jgi:uncharacterized UPF0160 family protein
MPVLVATHSGPFHADDVLAWALVGRYVDATATLVRTREKDVLAGADIVFDVGGVFDPDTRRFDHHQADYQGPLSSAGMVLNWLESAQRIDSGLAAAMREQLVDYVDDVDNGRVAPDRGRPCYASMVAALCMTATDHTAFDDAFLRAADIASAFLEGIEAGFEQKRAAEAVVTRAMEAAQSEGRRVIYLDDYYRWKDIYFAHNGVKHPTDYVLFPATDGSWRIVAIPPVLGSMAQKRPLPQSWAGLSDGALEQVTGVKGAVFCHKNRFIAVFQTRDGALDALSKHGLLHQ